MEHGEVKVGLEVTVELWERIWGHKQGLGKAGHCAESDFMCNRDLSISVT